MNEVSIGQLQASMASGQVSAAWLTRFYLARIAELDRSGPKLNSILETNPDALEIAAELDEERRTRGARGPLHGIPIVLKDNINTGDKMMTSAGSLALEGWRAPKDSPVAAGLRAAGAVILAKANMSEWANFRSTRSSSGWSSRGGQVRSAYVLDRNPSGSSSGSAVAAAANLCAAAVGSETNGSIIAPSSRASLVGVKPTIGRVSQEGIIPISSTLDTAGPMARSVEDAALVLQAMMDEPLETGPARHDLTGVRLGVSEGWRGRDSNVDRALEPVLAALEKLGAELVHEVDIEVSQETRDRAMIVTNYEFKAGINAYLRDVDPKLPVHTLTELIAFNQANAETVMPFFGQERLLASEATGSLEEGEYREALAGMQDEAKRLMDGALRDQGLDAIIAPSNNPSGLTDHVNGDSPPRVATGQAAVLAGYPIVTVPAAFFAGLPLGLSFLGGSGEEGKLLSLAAAFEAAHAARRAPGFLPHAAI